ncbi:MAG: ribonuclease P protein component 1 [Candidatus Micrarchaeia archaeon]
MRNKNNIIAHELIGLNVEVVNCSDPYQIGNKGKIIYETKNLIIIKKKEKIIKLIKKNCVFKFYLPDGEAIVKGEDLAYDPVKRTEKNIRKVKKW